MITIMDEIELSASAVPEVRQRLQDEYLPAAQQRGLSLSGQWLSPPTVLPDQPNTLWLQWQVADVMSYYGMRAGQDASVEGFWRAVDAIASARRRHVMVAADADLGTMQEPS